MGGHGNFLEKCIPSLTAKDHDTNVFVNLLFYFYFISFALKNTENNKNNNNNKKITEDIQTVVIRT